MMADKGETLAHLHGHHHLRRPMEDLLHGAVVPLAQLAHHLDLIHVDLKACPVLEVNSFRMQHRFRREPQ